MRINENLLLLIILTVNFSYSQNISSSGNDALLSNTRNLVMTPKDESSDIIEGSKYITDTFLPSYINDDKQVYFLRYDAFNDEIEVKREDGVFLIPKDYGFLINFSNNRVKYKAYNFKENKDGFFKVVKDLPKASLLIKERVKFFKRVKAESGFEKNKPASYKRAKDKYFIGLNKTHVAIEIPRKTKDFLKTFEFKSKEIENYIKSNKIKLKKEKDLIKLTEYLNSIL